MQYESSKTVSFKEMLLFLFHNQCVYYIIPLYVYIKRFTDTDIVRTNVSVQILKLCATI